MIKLAKWEEKLLPLALQTPRTWGLWIMRRNQPLLKAALQRRTYTGEVGCPHCIESRMNCDECLWEKVFGSLTYTSYNCMLFSFGMIKGDGMKGVNYWQNKEQVKGGEVNTAAISFLKAHILWGERIYDGIYKVYANQENK